MSKQLTILISIFAMVFSPVLFNTADTISAEDTFWEGGIAISSYGQLPRSGFYAASNAFPADSKVKVRNSETGEAVEVRVVERLDDPHLFMLVSPEAGKALGITENEIVNATVAPVSERTDIASAAGAEEPAYSLDPDRNPMADIEEIEEPKDSEGLSVLRDYLDEEEPPDSEPPEESSDELEEIVEPEIALESSEPEEPEEKEEPEEQEEPEEPEEPEEKEEPETPRVTVIRDVEEEPESSEPSSRVTDVPADPPVEEGETAAEREAPSAEGMSVAERPAVEIEIRDRLPRPKVREDTAKRDEVLPPEKEAEEKRRSEALEPEEEVETPGWDRLEPLFARKRDNGYSPPSPLLPEAADEEEEGPTPSMVYLETYLHEKGISYTSPEPGLPEVEQGVADIEELEPTEKEVVLAKLHTPEIPEDMPPEDVPKEGPEAGEEELAEDQPAADAEEPEAEEPEADGEEPEERSIPEEAKLVLTPAEERPPEGKPDREYEEQDIESEETEEQEEKPARKTEEPDRESEVIAQAHFTESLAPSSYYLQLAAYQEIETAERLAGKLLPRYPVTIYEGGDETFPYKVMVGPLNEDESGAILYSFTSRGYRDAFLRRGN